MPPKNPPYCFGKLNQVFPMGPDGLRQSPESCFPCFCKTECLKTAMQGQDGLKVAEEQIERADEAGMLGFLERWSRKKSLHQRKKGK